MALQSSVLVLVLALAGVECELSRSVRGHSPDQSLVMVPKFQHKLRACNAYTDADPMEVVLVSGGKRANLTQAGLLPYKECADFPATMSSGDNVEFRLRGSFAGAFVVQKLPQNDAELLLVVHRRSPGTRAPAFTSHVFAPISEVPAGASQVVILDTYKGAAKSSFSVREIKGTEDKPERKEELLAYNAAMSVKVGSYDCVLKMKYNAQDGTSAKELTKPLEVEEGQSYVAIRVGEENLPGRGFGENLVVFPHSSALRFCVSGVLGLLALLLHL